MSTLKKYVLGGHLPSGYSSGKNCIISGSLVNCGYRVFTLSSSYFGTLISYTSFFFNRFFLPARMALRWSLVTTVSGGR